MLKLLFARPDGSWLDFPALEMAARSGDELVLPEAAELIPLPTGATLTALPGRYPIGYDRESNALIPLRYNPYQEGENEVWAVGALLPQGFTRTLLPAITNQGTALPLLGYTAVGIDEKGQLLVAALPTDEHYMWHPDLYNTAELPHLISEKLAEFPHNHTIQQLAKCAREYGCFTAQNIFYRRFEGGLPISPACNARCIGCISLQPAECCPSPQNRISQPPTVAEGSEIALAHLQADPNNIISFGQGCEGEPSLQGDLASDIIRAVRQETKQGTINMNTNAGKTSAIAKIIEAGIDSFRVSMISAIPETYHVYYRPVGYDFANVCQSLRLAQEAGVRVAINLLAYPGLTDRVEEMEAWAELIEKYGVAQVQLRNLNIDPAIMSKLYPGEAGIGTVEMLRWLEEQLPNVAFGNYSRPVKK